MGFQKQSGLAGIRMNNGSDSFVDRFNRNREHAVWRWRAQSRPFKTGEGLKTSCLLVLNLSIQKLSEPLINPSKIRLTTIGTALQASVAQSRGQVPDQAEHHEHRAHSAVQ